MEMDRIKTKQTETVKDIPPVPIKTYKWEDIRRDKKKGRYPYTYLDRGPYNEEIDPLEFRMDSLRPSKSASVLEKSSSGIDIQEIVDDNGKSTNNDKHYLEPPNEGIVDAADSSNEDNISQYLDRDDDPPIITEHIETPGPSKEEEEDKMDVVDDKFTERAKSEEPKRKRKLSIESSYSRISLSRLGVMKKLREAKEKVKLPKFSFSKSESKLDIPKKTKKDGKKGTTKDTKKSAQTYLEPKKDETPVYIHIPLKPPPGQTDEFSYLEFEDKKIAPTKKPPTPTEESIKATEPTIDEKGKEGVQFIILTAPSDDEKLDDPGSASPNGNAKKFFDNTKLKDLQSFAKGVDEISPDMPIEGIIFEDVIQVEYVDEHNRPIGTTERSNFLEITEENLPKLEKKLSQRNLAKELEKEIASSMDSLNKIARKNTLKKLKEQQKARSIETLKKVVDQSNQILSETQEAPELTTPSCSSSFKEKSDDVAKILEHKTEEKQQEPKKDEIESEATKEELTEPVEDKPKVEETTKITPVEPTDSKAMFDEEDGLKITQTTVKAINEDQDKEKLSKTAEETLKAKADSIKKKVSFKRRSKQEDPDGIYEDVKVSGKKGNGSNKNAKETTSLEGNSNKWSKLTDHEYEPVNPPVDNNIQQPPQPITSVTVKRTESKESRKSRQSKKSPSNSIRIRLKDDYDDDMVQNDEEIDSGDALSAEDLQTRIEDQFFSNASVPEQDNLTSTTNTTIPTISSKESGVQESRAKRIQDAFKTQAGNLRTKMKNIKKPNIHMPQRPNFERFKIQKPNINIPKIPDQMRVNLPSFTLPKKGAAAKKRSIKERQFSTESNAGDSKKKLFDFSTYPRIFGRKKKTNDIDDDFETSSTVPRAKKSTAKKKTAQNSGKAKETEKKKKSPDIIRIPLHSEESMDKGNLDLSSHGRYDDDDIDMNDEYLKESQQVHMASEFSNDFSRNRWNHGSFHGHNLNEIEDKDREIKITDLDNEVDMPQPSPEPEIEIESVEADIRQSDTRVVSSTGDIHRQGVLEKINSDEYFIREKGISQDNIQMGELLSAEIREAFKQPINSLAKLENDSFDREFDVSDQSIQEVPKRRPIKKPKRKKTPNVSKERIPYDQESEPEEYPQPHDIQPQPQPARPKRKSKQKKKTKDDDRPPYQETILVQANQVVQDFDVMRKAVSDNTLLSDRTIDANQFRDDHYQQEYPQPFDNERLLGFDKHREELHMMDDYDDDDNLDGYNKNFSYENERLEFDRMNILGSGLEPYMTNNNLDSYEKSFPAVPPRKQRSMKSLESEHDSITEEYNLINENLPQQNIEAYRVEHEYIIPTPQGPPIRPQRTRSRTRSESRATDQPEDDQFTVEPEIPCIEEPCLEKTVDYMGYAVIAKSNKCREPPLPPPTRRKKSSTPLKSDTKFSTVPRSVKEEIPVRPMRNYSTLVPKSKRSATNIEDEKENIDLGQYIEIDDEEDHSRLQSGDIVQKMKDRPLPAPPRPPRKTKDSDKDSPFKDITYKNNADEEESVTEKFEETEVSVQTEPLPDDFVCEEFVREKGDRTITPTPSKTYPPVSEIVQEKRNETVTPTPSKTHPPITEFENVETITHGALIVATVPNNFQEEGPITNFSRSTEKIITIRREVDNDEVTSEPPEHFKSLKEPQPQIIERIIERPIHTAPEVEVLKAQKLQIGDLDVDRLMVNELLASKIKVSEIDGDSINVAEINPKSGNLIIGGLEIPVNFLQDIMEKLTKAQSSAENQSSQSRDVIQEQESLKSAKSEQTDLVSEHQETELLSKQEDKELLPETKKLISLTKEEEEDQQQPQQTEKDKESVSKHEDNVTLDVTDTLSTKLEEAENKQIDTLPLKNDEASEDLSKKKRQTETEELATSTIQETIDYLDKLIKENAALNLEEKIEGVDNEDILKTSRVSSEEKPILTEEQVSADETSEIVEIGDVPLLIPDTSEEERLLEELRSSSPEQKKNSV